MARTLFALFSDAKEAGDAIAELKEKGFTDNISLIAKDEENGQVKSHQIKESVTEGVLAGGAVGAVMGALAGIIAGLTSLTIPGIGVALVGGPVFASWAASGAAAGALAGGVTGALVDAGIPEEKAKMLEKYVQQGQVLVAVTISEEKEELTEEYLRDAGADDVVTLDTKE